MIKASLEKAIKQVRLEGGLERGGRIRVAECLGQTVSNSWASVRKRFFTKCFRVYARVTKVCASDADPNCFAGA